MRTACQRPQGPLQAYLAAEPGMRSSSGAWSLSESTEDAEDRSEVSEQIPARAACSTMMASRSTGFGEAAGESGDESICVSAGSEGTGCAGVPPEA